MSSKRCLRKSESCFFPILVIFFFFMEARESSSTRFFEPCSCNLLEPASIRYPVILRVRSLVDVLNQVFLVQGGLQVVPKEANAIAGENVILDTGIGWQSGHENDNLVRECFDDLLDVILLQLANIECLARDDDGVLAILKKSHQVNTANNAPCLLLNGNGEPICQSFERKIGDRTTCHGIRSPPVDREDLGTTIANIRNNRINGFRFVEFLHHRKVGPIWTIDHHTTR